MKRPLEGVRVVEHGTFITGPAAGVLLADLGADVIKVELPGSGDPLRAFKGGLYSTHYQAYNRNKRSVTLDTRDPGDREIFDALIVDADVYIQNFRPGVAEQIGAGATRLRELNRRLVYCAISGFGPDGPYAERPCYDTVAQAYSGFLRLLVAPSEPRVMGPAIADAVTGFYAAYGILGALYGRAYSDQGCEVGISMLEAMTHFNVDAFQHLFSSREVLGAYDRARVSQSYVLACRDGAWISLHMSSPEKFWQGLASATERGDILLDPRFADRHARIINHDALIAELQEVFLTRDRDEWCERLRALDVPYAPVYDTAEAVQDPQLQHLRMFIQATQPDGSTWCTVRPPVVYDRAQELTVRPPPMLGEHTDEVRVHGWQDTVHR
ncbi:CaiB/BaiF CoA transferase family protein [Xanthomonas axonopodis]|uniref:CaiB/BaiF CoA transferase family protein n=1 Tax=Xanthomonas axonopodis TaxID=53413 RepID=UPI003556176C